MWITSETQITTIEKNITSHTVSRRWQLLYRQNKKGERKYPSHLQYIILNYAVVFYSIIFFFRKITWEGIFMVGNVRLWPYKHNYCC